MQSYILQNFVEIVELHDYTSSVRLQKQTKISCLWVLLKLAWVWHVLLSCKAFGVTESVKWPHDLIGFGMQTFQKAYKGTCQIICKYVCKDLKYMN